MSQVDLDPFHYSFGSEGSASFIRYLLLSNSECNEVVIDSYSNWVVIHIVYTYILHAKTCLKWHELPQAAFEVTGESKI